ncbi:MAG: PAS-domain containing protein [Bauldia sp.]
MIRSAALSVPILGASSPAFAQTSLGATDVVLVSALVGTVSFAVIAVLILIRARARAEGESRRLLREIGRLRAIGEATEAILDADDQRIVVWDARSAAPSVVGELPRSSAAPSDRARFLAFSEWLSDGSAAAIDAAIRRLRDRGEPFRIALGTRSGTMIGSVGRAVGGRAVVWFRDLTGDRLSLATLEERLGSASDELASFKAALDAAPIPAWLRGRDRRLVWVNAAYASAVGARDAGDAVARKVELLDDATRRTIAEVQTTEAAFRRRVEIASHGRRQLYAVTDVVVAGGSAGLALDATEVEAAQAAVRRISDFHTRTLDHLTTAVALFGPDRRLRSANAAYRSLFGLDAAFLDAMPDENAILDRLRATRKAPEQADFRAWKSELLSAYGASEPREHLWHLPEGQTLRVIANPHPQGGMTWIYENVTERLGLESRYNALIRIQGETLDHMREGVAVFGSDGRLRLHNPSFADIWSLDRQDLAARPHVAEIAAKGEAVLGEEAAWRPITSSVAGVDESRTTKSGRMERSDGTVIDYATMPLPEGQTMVTFVDVTDSVRVERALTDRNEALEAADRLKNEFIQHVSYELRSPLTNIIGFTEMIAAAGIGPLNDKQREYLGYVMQSGNALLTLVNDILDLATIDAGIMALELSRVDLPAAVQASIDGLRDRLAEAGIVVDARIPSNIGTLVADEKRLRQILYNLLSNAVTFSSAGGKIVVSAERNGAAVAIEVADEGVGIPDDFIGLVFDRFESRKEGPIRGGAGLGLAIVKSFVELHGGEVAIRSAAGEGTVVRVTFPLAPAPVGIAAA